MRESTGETDERKARKFVKRRLAEVVTGTLTDVGSIRYEVFLDYAANGQRSLKREADGNFSTARSRGWTAYFMGFKADEIAADEIKRFARATGEGLVERFDQS